ncbi:MAG: hypothetical protein ACQES5_06020 [Thermodesulfobacteriota bacterium]
MTDTTAAATKSKGVFIDLRTGRSTLDGLKLSRQKRKQMAIDSAKSRV